MDPAPTPDPQEVTAVETSLYNRMVRNALKGFFKTAVIGVVIGLALGGIAGAAGFIAGADAIQGALHGALWFAGLAGSFGAVAGIQSTRDTRRWFLQHEDPALSPEETREPSIVIQPTVIHRMPVTFEVVDKNTPGYLDKINKKELSMLVQMLEDLDHSALGLTSKAYGYNAGEWDEAAFDHYKKGRLQDRFSNENYTFFLLRDAGGEVVALASGNAMEDKSQLRILNLTTDRGHRGQGYAKELMKHVAHYAAEQRFEKVVMPLSHHAIAKGNVDIYQHIAETVELETAMRPHPWDPKSIEMVVAPKKFLSLAHSDTGLEPFAMVKPSGPSADIRTR